VSRRVAIVRKQILQEPGFKKQIKALKSQIKP